MTSNLCGSLCVSDYRCVIHETHGNFYYESMGVWLWMMLSVWREQTLENSAPFACRRYRHACRTVTFLCDLWTALLGGRSSSRTANTRILSCDHIRASVLVSDSGRWPPDRHPCSLLKGNPRFHLRGRATALTSLRRLESPLRLSPPATSPWRKVRLSL